MAFSSNDKVIDSREVIDRLRELLDEKEAIENEIESIKSELEETESMTEEHDTVCRNLDDSRESLRQWEEENAEELASLESLNEEGESEFSDWSYGTSLINADYFEEYCQDMLVDCCTLPKNLPHYIVIDWEATADNLRADYTVIEFEGQTFLAR